MKNKLLILFIFINQFIFCQISDIRNQAKINAPENYSFEENHKFGIKTREGNILLKPDFDYINELYDNIFIVEKNRKQGIFDFNRIVIPANFQRIKYARKNVFIVENDGLTFVYNRDEKLKEYNCIIEINENILVTNGLVFVTQNTNKEKKIVFENGSSIPDKYSYVNIFDNVIIASFNNKWGLIKNGREITNFIYDQIDTVGFKYKQKSENGYILRFKIANYFIVKLDNKFGIINSDGSIIKPIKFDNIIFNEETNSYLLYENKNAFHFDGNK